MIYNNPTNPRQTHEKPKTNVSLLKHALEAYVNSNMINTLLIYKCVLFA